MAFDAHKNLAIAAINSPPSPPASGPSLILTAGHSARFPTPPFNATIFPTGQLPTPANAEIVRVTSIVGDAVFITRAQEGSTARTIVSGDLLALTITAKTLTDLEAGTNFPLITTPGAITAGGGVVVDAVSGQIRQGSVDGADNRTLTIAGGGAGDPTRGSYLFLSGNEATTWLGGMNLVAGDAAAGAIKFYTAAGPAHRGTIHRSGFLSWGSDIDPAVGNIKFSVNGGAIIGATTTWFTTAALYVKYTGAVGTGGIMVGTTTDVAGATLVYFTNAASAAQGTITAPNSTTVAYNTSSDARLKRDRGIVTTTDVLRQTVIHDFDWIPNGLRARGVFAQEAIAVLPAAITVGTDDLDADGQPRQPWQTDYAKYVPDLVVGWQDHDRQVLELTSRVASLETSFALSAGRHRLSVFGALRATVHRLQTWWRAPAPVKA
jgi:hypothetical protein